MKFINFTNHKLTAEQIVAAKSTFAEVVSIVSVDKPARFDDDGREDVAGIVNAIAREIVQLAQGEDAVVHFPISSPRVMAAFFEKKARAEFAEFSNSAGDNQDWLFIMNNCTFVFSFSRRISVDAHQPDGSVKKTSQFKFEKFLSY